MKKKIIAAALAISMMTTLAIGMTRANVTDTETAKNTFTVGNVKIELTEPGWKESGEVEGKTVYAGEALKKDPTVKNTGANPCFVRIKVDGLSLGENMMITLRTDWEAGISADWTRNGDYYYYNRFLDVGQTTDALFDQIVMPTGLQGDEKHTAHDITVFAEAIQAQGAMTRWDDVKAMKVPEIAKWFNDNMPTPTSTPTP